MSCPVMGDGAPASCTATYQKRTGQPIHSAGNRNPLSLDIGNVKLQGFMRVRGVFLQKTGRFSPLFPHTS